MSTVLSGGTEGRDTLGLRRLVLPLAHRDDQEFIIRQRPLKGERHIGGRRQPPLKFRLVAHIASAGHA